jgi:hypothetical protein
VKGDAIVDVIGLHVPAPDVGVMVGVLVTAGVRVRVEVLANMVAVGPAGVAVRVAVAVGPAGMAVRVAVVVGPAGVAVLVADVHVPPISKCPYEAVLE